MKKLNIDQETILKRINIIENALKELNKLKNLSFKKFMDNNNFAVAEHYLRYALEATFDICSHILSRIPGVTVEEYKQMATEMGNQDIVPDDFSEQKLKKMAGYRNRLTHFYAQIQGKEMYNIINENLNDFEKFLKHIKKVLQKNS